MTLTMPANMAKYMLFDGTIKRKGRFKILYERFYFRVLPEGEIFPLIYTIAKKFTPKQELGFQRLCLIVGYKGKINNKVINQVNQLSE